MGLLKGDMFPRVIMTVPWTAIMLGGLHTGGTKDSVSRLRMWIQTTHNQCVHKRAGSPLSPT